MAPQIVDLEGVAQIIREFLAEPRALSALTEARVNAEPLLGVSPLKRFPDRLTAREVEVLRLLAGGRSNREIADDLVLSARTVERHIANIYAKINANGRAQATAYAMNHGFHPTPPPL